MFDGERYSVMDEDEAAAQGSAPSGRHLAVSPDDVENAPDLPGQPAVVKRKVTFEGEDRIFPSPSRRGRLLVSAPVDPRETSTCSRVGVTETRFGISLPIKWTVSLTLTARWEGVSLQGDVRRWR